MNSHELARQLLAKPEREVSTLAHEIAVEELKKRLELAKKNLEAKGFKVVKDAEFYRVGGYIGMKVGQYTHSCHIETSDILILLLSTYYDKVEDPRIQEFWDDGIKIDL